MAAAEPWLKSCATTSSSGGDKAMSILQKVVDVGREVGVGLDFRRAFGASTQDADRLMNLTYIYIYMASNRTLR